MDADLTGRCGAVFFPVWCTTGDSARDFIRKTGSAHEGLLEISQCPATPAGTFLQYRRQHNS
jgi:hypothetical protein